MTRWGVLVAFLVIVAFFLLTEHRAHAWGVAPYLLLLACPLLHFLHGRHGDRGGRGRDGHHAGRHHEDAGASTGPGERPV
jgi:hypothetical protein